MASGFNNPGASVGRLTCGHDSGLKASRDRPCTLNRGVPHDGPDVVVVLRLLAGSRRVSTATPTQEMISRSSSSFMDSPFQ